MSFTFFAPNKKTNAYPLALLSSSRQVSAIPSYLILLQLLHRRIPLIPIYSKIQAFWLLFLPSHTLGCTEMKHNRKTEQTSPDLWAFACNSKPLVLVMMADLFQCNTVLMKLHTSHFHDTSTQSKLLSFAIQGARIESFLSEECSASQQRSFWISGL